MDVGIVRTTASACRCAEAFSAGLAALGHPAPLVVDADEVGLRAGDLAACDLVLDHTDTVRGDGALRPIVRTILEARGARLIGATARAATLADDKVGAKARLAAAGVPVPEGVVVTRLPVELPPGLDGPLVVKAAWEHMSRGLGVAATREEAAARARELLERTGQAVLVERLVPGRELGVSLLAGPDGLEALPPVEWRLGAPDAVLTHALKFADRPPPPEPAELDDETVSRLARVAVRAFEALELADYARVDLRLRADGSPVVLEVNARPSLEPDEALARSAALAGLDHAALCARILEAAAARHGGPVSYELGGGRPITLWQPPGVHRVAASTVELARRLDVVVGDRVVDLGCGSGLLAIAAARQGGRVVATDVDPAALEATRRNADANGVGDRVEVRRGVWFGPLEDLADLDVVLATPPQTPGPFPFGAKYGGADGTEHLLHVIERAAELLHPQRGRLLLLAISLADPAAVRARLEARFARVERLASLERPFRPAEYDALCPGLWNHLRALRAAGKAAFERTQDGWAFESHVWRASGPLG